MVKNTLKTILLLALVWTVLPTGLSDIFIIPFIISRIGFNGYLLLSIVLIILLYKSVDGKTLKDKIHSINKELKEAFK